MKMHKKIYTISIIKFWFILVLLGPGLMSAQVFLLVQPDTLCPEIDLTDLIRGALNKPPKVKSVDAGRLMLLPIIGSNPANGHSRQYDHAP